MEKNIGQDPFAYEDRKQIAALLFETYTRLTAAASINNTLISPIQGGKTAIMRDAVSKNHRIGELVTKMLKSNHIPYHLFCKAHTAEKLDASNLKVSSAMEKGIKQRDEFERIKPSLKPFFRGKKTVVEAGILALLRLVTHDKSANSCSLAAEFDYIVEREK